MPVLDINSEKNIKYTAKLERLHRSALPSAIRNTLNNAAFETKKILPRIADEKFIIRQAAFFRRFSIVEKANGFNIERMKSTVGINSSTDREIANNLVSQEFGGMVRAKKLIPHDDSRVSKSNNKRVRKDNRLNKVNVHNGTGAFKRHRGTRKSKFIAAVMGTAKSGKGYMMLRNGSKGMIYKISNVSQNRRNGKIKFKATKLYSVRSKKTHQVKGRFFMRDSAMTQIKKIPKYFKNNAEFQFRKDLKV